MSRRHVFGVRMNMGGMLSHDEVAGKHVSSTSEHAYLRLRRMKACHPTLHTYSRRVIWAAVLAAGVFPSASGADPLPDSFTLGCFVPDSCVVYAHNVNNPKRALIDARWEPVYAALKEAGLLDELRNAVADALEGEDRAAFEQFWARASELGAAVSWGDLVERETVVAGRVTPFPGVMVLFKGRSGTGPENLHALVELVEHVSSLSPSLNVVKEGGNGFATCTLTAPHVPVCLRVFGRGDVVGLSTCTLLAAEATTLMARGGGCGSIVDSPRFRKSVAALPSPEDGLFFVDWRAGNAGIRQLLGAPLRKAQDQGTDGVLTMLDSIIHRFDILDYTVGVWRTEGWRESVTWITALQPEAKGKTLARAFADCSPLEDPLSRIPVNATAFSTWSGADLGLLYTFLLDIIRQDIPNGDAALDRWGEVQAEIGFNVQEDLLSWLSGEIVTVTMPPTIRTPLCTADGVTLIRVSDVKLADRKVRAGLERLKALVQEHLGQPLTVTPATGVMAEGFQVVTLPMLAALVRPVVGLHGDRLIIATSERAINACLDTAAGKYPSVVKAKRFRTEGIRPRGAVYSASFVDLSDYGEGVSAGFFAAGMLGGMLPDEPEVRPFKAVSRVFTRLQPVVSKVDFLSSSSSVTTFDGLAWRTESVVTYRPPSPERP